MQIAIVGWVIGILWVANSAKLPPFIVILTMTLLLIALMAFSKPIRHVFVTAKTHQGALNFPKSIQLILVLFMGVLFGAGWASYRGAVYLDQPLIDGDWQIELLQTPKTQYNGSSVRARLMCRYQSAASDASCEALEKAWLSPDYRVQLHISKQSFGSNLSPSLPGEVWRLSLQFQDQGFSGNPGFDRDGWALSENLIAVAKVTAGDHALLDHYSSVGYWRHWFEKRGRYESSIEQSSYSNLPLMPLMNALILGDRSGLEEGHWQLFRETGTSHLMAISGLHVGALSLLVFWLVTKAVGGVCSLNNHIYPMRVAAIVAVLVAGGYAALSGFALPSQRALIMLTAAYAAVFWGRPKLVLHGLFLALFIILLIQPFAVLTASLWLSFFAVALIYFLISNRLTTDKGRFRQGLVALKIQGSIFIGMIPVTLYFFGGASLNSFIANLVAIPLITCALLPLGIINVIVATFTQSKVPLMGEFNLWLMDMLLLWLQWVSHVFADYYVRSISLAEMGLLLMAGLVTVAPIKIGYRFMSVGVFIVMLLFPGTSTQPRVVLLNQGQVLMAFDGSDGAKIVVDERPGYGFSEKAAIKAVVPGAVAGEEWASWQQSWEVNAWSAKLFSGSSDEKGAFRQLCGLSGHLWESVRVETIEYDGYCIAWLFWQGRRWLLVGDLPQEAQFGLLSAMPKGSFSDVSFLLLSGSVATGAFLERFPGVTAFIWSKEPLGTEWLERFQVRGIKYYSLVEQGAQVVAFSEGNVSISPAVPRRFYH